MRPQFGQAAAQGSPISQMLTTIYHVDTGPVQTYHVDAREAVANHPKEWSREPWPKTAASVPGQVRIPDDWMGLSPVEKRHLATRLGAPLTVTTIKAEERIAEEIEQRKVLEVRKLDA